MSEPNRVSYPNGNRTQNGAYPGRRTQDGYLGGASGAMDQARGGFWDTVQNALRRTMSDAEQDRIRAARDRSWNTPAVREAVQGGMQGLDGGIESILAQIMGGMFGGGGGGYAAPQVAAPPRLGNVALPRVAGPSDQEMGAFISALIQAAVSPYDTAQGTVNQQRDQGAQKIDAVGAEAGTAISGVNADAAKTLGAIVSQSAADNAEVGQGAQNAAAEVSGLLGGQGFDTKGVQQQLAATIAAQRASGQNQQNLLSSQQATAAQLGQGALNLSKGVTQAGHTTLGQNHQQISGALQGQRGAAEGQARSTGEQYRMDMAQRVAEQNNQIAMQEAQLNAQREQFNASSAFDASSQNASLMAQAASQAAQAAASFNPLDQLSQYLDIQQQQQGLLGAAAPWNLGGFKRQTAREAAMGFQNPAEAEQYLRTRHGRQLEDGSTEWYRGEAGLKDFRADRDELYRYYKPASGYQAPRR